jgi:hypothetical protein
MFSAHSETKPGVDGVNPRVVRRRVSHHDAAPIPVQRIFQPFMRTQNSMGVPALSGVDVEMPPVSSHRGFLTELNPIDGNKY